MCVPLSLCLCIALGALEFSLTLSLALSFRRRADTGIGLPKLLVLDAHRSAPAIEQRPRLEEVRFGLPVPVGFLERGAIDTEYSVPHPQRGVGKDAVGRDSLDDQQGPEKSQFRGVEADALVGVGFGLGECFLGVVAKDLVDGLGSYRGILELVLEPLLVV